MFIKPNDSSVRYTGRWYKNESAAVTTAPGSIIEIAYVGKSAVLYFDIENCVHPFGHLWMSVDGGVKAETAVDAFLRVEAEKTGMHIIKIVFKSAVETQQRWQMPLEAKIAFKGFEADGAGVLPDDNRKIIEFIGDSITEGVLIDEERRFYEPDVLNRPLQDDSTATYAYLTSQNLGLRPVIMGYGAVGICKGGNGGVPKASEAYPYFFSGEKMEAVESDYIVINHGANDRGFSAEEYTEGYIDFIRLLRSGNERAKIIVLAAFCGVYTNELRAAVARYNDDNSDNVFFIDTTGWISPEPLHPSRSGHIAVSEKLTAILKEIIGD